MRTVIDNNVIVDVFQNREPFFEASSKVLRLVETRRIRGFVTANSFTDIYYILHRSLKNKKQVHHFMNLLLKLVGVIDVTGDDIRTALLQDAFDFEDELICVCAEGANIDCIVTRNTKDFANSRVPAVAPETFITNYFKDA